jgi:hypothetical protein
MREIDNMAADLEAAMKVHSARALEATRAAAERMAEVAKGHSTPMYGVTVTSQATHSGKVSTVHVRTATGTGVGKVYGGEDAIVAQARRSMDQAARDSGLTGGTA